METTITAKLKLVTAPEQLRQVRLTQLAYRVALPSGQPARLCAWQDR
jgi:hypothetical protein